MKTFLVFLLGIVFLESSGVCAMDEKSVNKIITAIAEYYGYEDRLEAEKRDGLIVIDFRKIKPPQFASKSYGWIFYRSRTEKYFVFEWEQKISSLGTGALIEAYVFPSYENARERFIETRMSFTTMELPWFPCEKKLGSICLDSPDSLSRLIFVYKNIFIQIVGYGQLPNGEPLRNELAAWLFEILKNHPRASVFPETLEELSTAGMQTSGQPPSPEAILP